MRSVEFAAGTAPTTEQLVGPSGTSEWAVTMLSWELPWWCRWFAVAASWLMSHCLRWRKRFRKRKPDAPVWPRVLGSNRCVVRWGKFALIGDGATRRSSTPPFCKRARWSRRGPSFPCSSVRRSNTIMNRALRIGDRVEFRDSPEAAAFCASHAYPELAGMIGGSYRWDASRLLLTVAARRNDPNTGRPLLEVEMRVRRSRHRRRALAWAADMRLDGRARRNRVTEKIEAMKERRRAARRKRK